MLSCSACYACFAVATLCRACRMWYATHVDFRRHSKFVDLHGLHPLSKALVIYIFVHLRFRGRYVRPQSCHQIMRSALTGDRTVVTTGVFLGPPGIDIYVTMSIWRRRDVAKDRQRGDPIVAVATMRSPKWR